MKWKHAASLCQGEYWLPMAWSNQISELMPVLNNALYIGARLCFDWVRVCGLFIRHPYTQRDRTIRVGQWQVAAWWARHPTTASECMVLRTALLKITTCLTGRTRRTMIAAVDSARRIRSVSFWRIFYQCADKIALHFNYCLDFKSKF